MAGKLKYPFVDGIAIGLLLGLIVAASATYSRWRSSFVDLVALEDQDEITETIVNAWFVRHLPPQSTDVAFDAFISKQASESLQRDYPMLRRLGESQEPGKACSVTPSDHQRFFSVGAVDFPLWRVATVHTKFENGASRWLLVKLGKHWSLVSEERLVI